MRVDACLGVLWISWGLRGIDVWLFMTVKDEADRYLQSCLEWNSQFVSDIFVYDDCSDDATLEIARQFTSHAYSGAREITFAEHEGNFKRWALSKFKSMCSPLNGEWVLCLDADEFLVPNGDITDLKLADVESWSFPIVEVWETDPVERQRVDGFWAKQQQERMFRFHLDRQFERKAMGVGATPKMPVETHVADGWAVHHYGYAHPDDRVIKFERYNGRSGHSQRHIDSILQTPKLEDVSNPLGDRVWRGVR